MRVRQRQLSRVFNGHHALIGRDKTGNRVEHGGLAAARPPADENVAALAHGQLQQAGHAFIQGAEVDQVLHQQRIIAELADGDRRAIQRQRLDHHIDTSTVGQARIDHGGGFIQTATQRRNNAAHDTQHMGVVGEVQSLLLQHAFARDKDIFVAVDQNVFDLGVGHQVIQRAKARQLFVQGLPNPLHFLVVDGKALLAHKLLQLLVHKLAHPAGRPFGKNSTQLFHTRQQVLVCDVLDQQQLFGVRKITVLFGENDIHAHSPLLKRFAHCPRMLDAGGAIALSPAIASPSKVRAMLRMPVT